MARSRTLTLPKNNPDRVAQLTPKLAEYRGRFAAHQAPEAQMRTFLKIAVLKTLLQEGCVQTGALAGTLTTAFGPGFNPILYRDVCAVIADYCATGGKKNRGGTGLPPVPTSATQA